MSRREWTSMVCTGERHQSACLSWFRPFVPDAWGLPIAADVQEDVQTGRETAIRALFLRPDGRLKEAVRRMNSRSSKVILRDASPGILKSPSAQHAIANARTPSDGPGNGTGSTTDASQSPGMHPTSISKDQTP